MDIAIIRLNFNSNHHVKCTLVVKLISLINASNLFSLEVVGKCQHCQLFVQLREKLIVSFRWGVQPSEEWCTIFFSGMLIQSFVTSKQKVHVNFNILSCISFLHTYFYLKWKLNVQNVHIGKIQRWILHGKKVKITAEEISLKVEPEIYMICPNQTASLWETNFPSEKKIAIEFFPFGSFSKFTEIY